MHSIITFPLSLCVSDTLPLFLLQHATFSHPSLVSPKFPHVPLKVGGWPMGAKSEGVRLIVRAITFQDFQPMYYVMLIHPRFRRTHGGTDARTSCSRNTALCTKVHRAVKTRRMMKVT